MMIPPVSVSSSVFQSSPVPKDGRYSENLSLTESDTVSILTRPEGRALPNQGDDASRAFAVSILTRPEGRALPRSSRSAYRRQVFQSSPVPKDGRYHDDSARERIEQRVSILTRPEGRALQ